MLSRVRWLVSDMQIPGLQCDQINQRCPHLIFEVIYNEAHYWKNYFDIARSSASLTNMFQTQNHEYNASTVLMKPYDLIGQMHKCDKMSDYQGIIRAWNEKLVFHVTISTWHYGYNSSVSIMGSVMMHMSSIICIDCSVE